MTDGDHIQPRRRPQSRRAEPVTSWQRTGVVLLAGFVLWLVMDATVLQHNATVISPVGTRRTVALALLRPIAAFARASGLDLPVSGANVALGRTSDGGFVIPTVPTTNPTTPTTTTTLPRVATPAHRLRVLIIGDSIGLDLAAPLLADLDATGAATVWTDGQISTGLTRLDYFNWIAELEYDVYHDRPQVIVGMMGANDPQAFPSPDYMAFNTPQWRARYLRNAGQLFTIGRSAGRQFLWVSVPVIADRGRNLEWQVIRGLQHKAAAAHRVLYFDSNSVLAPHGSYAAYLRVGGQLALVRQPDGIHLTPAGGALLASAVMAAIQRDLHIRFR